MASDGPEARMANPADKVRLHKTVRKFQNDNGKEHSGHRRGLLGQKPCQELRRFKRPEHDL
jgi:hypothetical protein